jgi:hypothetical protein
MRYGKVLARFGVLVGLAVGAAGTLSAHDWDDEWHGRDHRRQDLRHDYRDLHGDYAQVNAMRADIARDRARLNEDIGCGREAPAARDAADLAAINAHWKLNSATSATTSVIFIATSRAINAGGNATVTGSLQGAAAQFSVQSRLREHCHALRDRAVRLVGNEIA